MRAGAGRTAEENADRVLYACLARGLSFKIGGGGVITLCPPLSVTDEELARALDILTHAVAEVSVAS